jgi:hypothetical protein
MPVENIKRSKSGRVQAETISQATSSLQSIPEKKKELISLQEAIHQLRVPIETALGKGYSYQELAAMLQQQGILIGVSTLRNYLSLSRQQTPIGKASKKLRSRSLGDGSKRPSSTVEVFIPSKAEISSYIVGHDFWNAYQESLKEREEVYRRLAES